MNGPRRTIHVALTDGDRVWLDDDGLPAFVQDPDAGGPTATAVASGLLADAVHLAPVVVLDGGNRLHVVGARSGKPTRGRWADPSELPDDIRGHVTAAFHQLRGAPPERRADWYRTGWHDDVETWLDVVLPPTGRARTGPLRTHRVWSISAVFTVPTDRGELWFKASGAPFGAEAGIVETVARHLPDLALEVVAVDRDRCWLLTEPLAGVRDHGATAPAAEALAPLWAAAQVASTQWLDDLRSAGAPDRGLDPTLTAWHEALATNPECEALTDAERRQLGAVVPTVDARLRELWGCGFPDTLGHGDLHSGNVAFDADSVRIFDWSDGCITHPFLDGTHLAHWLAEEDRGDAAVLTRKVLAPWRAAYPGADFERAVELAPLADLVFQTVTFDKIAGAIEPGTGDFDGVVMMLTRRIIDMVAPALGF